MEHVTDRPYIHVGRRPTLGSGCDTPIVSDILIEDDGLHPRRAVELLAERIRSGP